VPNPYYAIDEMALCSEFNTSTCSPEDYIIYSNNKTLRHILLKVPLAIYLTKNKNTTLLIMKSFKLDKTFKKRNKIGLSARIIK
jgi:hypothetical protein